VILLLSVFAVASCGLVYELIAGAISSYLLGDAVTQFSLVIGVFLCAMGAGSYLAKFFQRDLLAAFVEIEIWIGLIGGISSMLMFAINAYFEPVFGVFFYSLCALLGVLVGVEIPLLVRILKAARGTSAALSEVLALDYLGALAGSILFPFLALPLLGLSRASVVFGVMNLAVATAGLSLLRSRRWWRALRLVAAAVVLLTAFFTSSRLIGFLEDRMYADDVILVRDSAYQHIVLTRWRDDVRLFLNGHIQFSSVDEARYHEALVVPAMAAATVPRSVLILGGGDGLAAREVLKYPSVQHVTLVDIDPLMTELAQQRRELVQLNKGSLGSDKVQVVNADAMAFVRDSREFYDVIIVDLPDPNSAPLARLYSVSFYQLLARRLALGGVLVTQATSPYFAAEAFWCIVATVSDGETGLTVVLPYHVHVPSFGEWGFVLAAAHRVEPTTLSVEVPTRYLTDSVLEGMFHFGLDMQPPQVEANTLDEPVLFQYYQRGWNRFNE